MKAAVLYEARTPLVVEEVAQGATSITLNLIEQL